MTKKITKKRTKRCKPNEELFMGDVVKLNMTIDGIRQGTEGKIVQLTSRFEKSARNGRKKVTNHYKVRFRTNGVSRTLPQLNAKYLDKVQTNG